MNKRNAKTDSSSTWWRVPLHPLLLVRLWWFRRLIAGGTFPPAKSAEPAPREADQVAFIGSAAAARYGVTVDGLTTLARVAAGVSERRGKPFQWLENTETLLSARAAADQVGTVVLDADAAVVAIGFTDVLLMTPPSRWAADLSRLVRTVEERSGVSCGIILAGIPPMDQFRQSSRLGRDQIRKHVTRLNEATKEVAELCGPCVFVPFPALEPGMVRMRKEEYSWATIHQLWSQALADALVEVLDRTPPPESAT